MMERRPEQPMDEYDESRNSEISRKHRDLDLSKIYALKKSDFLSEATVEAQIKNRQAKKIALAIINGPDSEEFQSLTEEEKGICKLVSAL